MVETSPL